MRFWRHLLSWEKRYMTFSYYYISFSKSFKLILELIHLLVVTKSRSPHYFCVLHIVSSFVFTMLLIFQVTKLKMYGFMCYILIERGSKLIQLLISLQFFIHQASSIIHIQAIFVFIKFSVIKPENL